ncbi:hypothetical protein BVH03_08405 [Pseudomonas sp. PA15(2017)]|nr:hypothetical protein BVH03_08405 [Pseudomonas sp. PA15(2017)]
MRSVVQHHQRCEICQGSGEYRGVFHRNCCVACNGAGVVLTGGEAMSPEQAIAYLRQALTAAEHGAPRPARKTIAGDAEHYQQANTRGLGGSHYSGD